MVGPLRGVGAAGRERVSRPCVSGKAPAAPHRLIHRAAHERVAEDELARHVGRAHEVEDQQVVEGREPGLLAQPGDRRRKTGLERLARHRRPVQQRARLGRQRLELTGDRARNRRGHPGLAGAVAEHRGQVGALAGPAELLEVERVAAAVAVDRRDVAGVHSLQQPAGLRLAEVAELEPVNPLTGQRRAQTLGGLAGAHAEGKQDRRSRLPAGQRGDQLERRAVAPVQVVQHQHERPLVGYQAQEATDRAMGPVALVRDGRRGAVGSLQRREHLGELGAQLLIPGLVLVEVLRDHVRVERIHPHAERHLALELGRRPGEHHVAALLGARAQLSRRRVLPMPGSPSRVM